MVKDIYFGPGLRLSLLLSDSVSRYLQRNDFNKRHADLRSYVLDTKYARQ